MNCVLLARPLLGGLSSFGVSFIGHFTVSLSSYQLVMVGNIVDIVSILPI